MSKDVPALNKVLEVFAPFDLLVRLILELGNRLAHDVCQQINETSARLHFRAVCWEGEAMLGDFEQCDAERPDVRCDGVGLSCNAFRRHVIRCADESVCVALGTELAADTEVAELDVATARDQDVAGLDVSVNDAA